MAFSMAFSMAVVTAVVTVAVTADAAATCAYAASRETCSSTTGFDAASASASASACGGAVYGRVACEAHSNGVAFDGVSTRLVASAPAAAWVNAARASKAFTVEIAAALRAPASGGSSSSSGRQPLVTLSTTDVVDDEALCLDAIGGYDLAVWLENRRVVAQMREPWSQDGSLSCSSTSGFQNIDVQLLGVGDIHRIAVVYDVDGIRVWVNGTQSVPPPSSVNVKLSPGGEAASMWNTTSSKFIFGAQGGKYFKGTMYEVRLHDRALSADEIVERANTPLTNSSPHPVTQNVTMDEDAIAAISLDAVDAEGDVVYIRIVRLPNRGALCVDSACSESITTTPYQLRAREVWYAPARDEYSAPDVDYATFEFIAIDDAGGVNVDDRGVVHVRVRSLNDAPESSRGGGAVISIFGYAPTRAQFSARDVDQVCPPDYPDCARDSFKKIVITRAPALGTLYASCGDTEALDGSVAASDGWTRSAATGMDNDALLCFTYVYSGDVVIGNALDDVEYVIHDAYGATSATLKTAFSIQSPCIALSREHVIDEDNVVDLTFTAVCVDASAAHGLTAHVSSLPKHGTASSDTMKLRESSCSIEQHAACETWANNTYRGGAPDDNIRCVCGAIGYAPPRDYFNTPSIDLYGVAIALGDANAPHWPVGAADAMSVTLATSNGWRTTPYATYVWVRAALDLPKIRIDRHWLRNIEPIVPETTSYVLSNAIDIDVHPDYDVDAMAVTLSSTNARTLDMVADDVLQGAGESDDMHARLLPDVDDRPNAVRFIGAPSAIRRTLRSGTIAYVPFDATAPAFYDVIHVRVVVGIRPLTSPPCVSPWQTPPCRFTSIIDVPPCGASNFTATTSASSCAVDVDIHLPVADAPSYVAQKSHWNNPKNRTRAERAAVVFAIVFAFAFVVTAIALKFLKLLRAALNLIGSF